MTVSALVRSFALGVALLALAASVHADTFPCMVTEVKSFSNRVHVSCKWDACSQGNYGYCFNDIHYFAVPASDSSMALRFNAMASTAVGDFLLVDYDRHADGSWFGCLYSNCRPVISFAREG